MFNLQLLLKQYACVFSIHTWSSVKSPWGWNANYNSMRTQIGAKLLVAKVCNCGAALYRVINDWWNSWRQADDELFIDLSSVSEPVFHFLCDEAADAVVCSRYKSMAVCLIKDRGLFPLHNIRLHIKYLDGAEEDSRVRTEEEGSCRKHSKRNINGEKWHDSHSATFHFWCAWRRLIYAV